MNIPKSAVSYPEFQESGYITLPFAKDLATHLLRPDYDALVEAMAFPDSEESQSFILAPKDKPIVPPQYFRAEWELSDLAKSPCTWCGLADDLGHPKTPNHFWTATYRAIVRPFSSDGIYVIDGNAFNEARESLFSRCFNGGHGRKATEEEIGECYLAQARTLAPLADYYDRKDEEKFATPVVVIFRKLLFGEITALPIRVQPDP